MNPGQLFSHNIGVITAEEQAVLSDTCVAIAGVGGVGGNVAHILARSGVRRFLLADPDVFSEGNINRQFGATPSTVGKKKVHVVSELIHDINPSVEIKTFEEGITSENVEEFLEEADVVVDAIDFLSPHVRRELIHTAQKHGLYLFLSPAFGFGASLIVFSPEGLSYEQFFGETSDKFSPAVVIKHGRKIFPIIPSYIDLLSYARGIVGKSHIPTFCPAVMLAAAVTAGDVILQIIGRREPVCVPRIKWIDLLEQKVRIVNVRWRSRLLIPDLLIVLRIKRIIKKMQSEEAKRI
jgi:molybdopterin/thiamine biosynthesis adenylyltransferase